MTSQSFADLGVPEEILEALNRRGMTQPTPIQVETIAHGLEGRDVSGRAPTGSGKTLAFGIPMVTNLAPARKYKPRALVLAPTRELADQIANEIKWLGAPLGVSVTAVYGGVGYGGQRAAFKRGVDVVVACPGRLEDLLEQGALQLSDVERVTLDEADRMADMGFMPSVKRILSLCTSRQQVTMFSATLDKAVAKVSSTYQNSPVRCEVEDLSAEPNLDHQIAELSRDERVIFTANTVKNHGSTIVFCRTKRGADRLAQQLGKQGVKSAAIHGDRSQNQRQRALDSFERGKVSALIATDVAARGIHVDDVRCVVHYDPPEEQATYVHRSGRTGRAGNTGVVVSLILDGGQKKTLNKWTRSLGVELRPAGSAPLPHEAPAQLAPSPAMSAQVDSEITVVSRERTADAKRAVNDKPFKAARGRDQERAKPRTRHHERSEKHSSSGRPLQGTIQHYNEKRGYGFISHNGTDYFFHKSQLQSSNAQAGQVVKFSIGRGQRGDEAKDVTVDSSVRTRSQAGAGRQRRRPARVGS